MTDQPKRRGRPPLPDSERKTGANLTFRARSGLRDKLMTEVQKSDRSLSEEIERRIERSFEWEEMFGEARNYLADHKNKVDQMSEKSAELFLRRAGWPKIAGTAYGTVLAKPGSIAPLSDGRAGRVQRVPFPSGGFVVEPDEALGIAEPFAPSPASAGLEARVERIERTLERAGLVEGEKPSS